MYRYTKKIAKITGMIKCPNCPMAIEKDQNYCGGCGIRLQSKLKIAEDLFRRGKFKLVLELLTK